MHPVSQVILHCVRLALEREEREKEGERDRGNEEGGETQDGGGVSERCPKDGRETSQLLLLQHFIHSRCDTDANHSGCRLSYQICTGTLHDKLYWIQVTNARADELRDCAKFTGNKRVKRKKQEKGQRRRKQSRQREKEREK